MNYFKYIFTATALLLIIDFFGFVAWLLSGQNPQDGFYLGRLTYELIHLFI